MEDLMPWEADLSAEAIEPETSDLMPWEADLSAEAIEPETSEIPFMQPSSEFESRLPVEVKELEQISTLGEAEESTYRGSLREASSDLVDRLPEIAENTGEYGKQIVAGARKPLAGAAKAIEETFGYDTGAAEAVDKLNAFTEEYNKLNPDDMIHPSTVGNLATYMVLPWAKGAMANTMLGGLYGYIDAEGNNKGEQDKAISTIIGAVTGGVGTAAINKIMEKLDPLSKEAKILLRLNQGRVSEDEAVKLLKGIPKEDQTIALAEQIDLAKNYFKGAAKDDSITSAMLGKRLEQRKQITEPFLANENDLLAASKQYGEMRKTIDEGTDSMVDLTSANSKIDEIADIYATDPSGLGTAIKQIKADLSEPITPGTALDIRENINAMLRKTSIKKSRKSTEVLTDIKSKLDDYVETSIPKELNEIKDKAIGTYRETINNYNLGKIIEKNTKSDYAVNWGKVVADIKKEGLSSSNIDRLVPIMKEFEKRFANDKYLGNAITPLGGTSEATGALGMWSKVVKEVTDLFSPMFNRSRYKDIQIVDSIKKSIRKSETHLDFVDDIFKQTERLQKSGKITKDEAEVVKQKLIEYKPQLKTTGDVNLAPEYRTAGGTAGRTPGEAKVIEEQTKLVREALSKPYSDKVVQRTSELINSKRFTSIMKSTADRMKADDIAKNTQILQTTLRSEVRELVKIINKETGAKLPASEVEKIYKMKLKEMLKECE